MMRPTLATLAAPAMLPPVPKSIVVFCGPRHGDRAQRLTLWCARLRLGIAFEPCPAGYTLAHVANRPAAAILARYGAHFVFP